jgi:hypothetical protein
MPEQLKPKQTAIEHFLDVNNNSPILNFLKDFRKQHQPKTLEPGTEILLKAKPESSPKVSETLSENLTETNKVELFNSKQYLDDIYSVFESDFADRVDLEVLKFKLNLIKTEDNFQSKTKDDVNLILSELMDNCDFNREDRIVFSYHLSDKIADKNL